MRVCVVGAGLAGSLLTWRLAEASPGWRVDLVTGRRSADATAASGGAVRAYEGHAEQRALAIASTAELLASDVLRDWAGFRQVTTTCLLADATGARSAVTEIDDLLPGSARLDDAAAIAALGWAGVADDAVAVTELRAGHTSPRRWRDRVVGDLALRRGVSVVHADATAIRQGARTATCDVGGARREYDLVVVAAGAWTAAVLRASGLPADGYRTKSIQYAVHDVHEWPQHWTRPLQFVDEAAGVFGRPVADDALLVGVPSDEWDVDPARPPVTAAQHDEAARLAAARFPGLRLGSVRNRVGSADCYCDDAPVLALRPVAGHDSVLTFTGGAGGSVKTALAASRRAAVQLVDTGRSAELLSVGRRKGQ